MKIGHYVIIFTLILLSVTTLVTFTVQLSVTINEEDEKYRETLYTATGNALTDVLDTSETDVTEKLWTQENIAIANQSINDIFEVKYNYPINSINDTTDWLIPIICYLDYEGFYIRYIGTENDQTANDKKVISGLNTWTKIVEEGAKKYNINYYLGKNILTVTTSDGITFTGSYDAVNEYLNYPAFLNPYTITENINGEIVKTIDTEKFNQDKDNFIILQTESILNYYLNNKDCTVGKLGRHISLNFDINDDALHKAFHNAGIVAFLQGPVMQYAYGKSPVVAFAHYQITKDSTPTYVTVENNILYYHKESCETEPLQRFIKKFKTTEEAAFFGASPCPSCF